jgi:uncharacterized protein
MSTLDANADELRTVASHSAPEPAPVAGPLTGDPAALGLPSFIVGSVALGLALVGMVPAASVGAALPVILAATSVGLFAAAIWAAAIGQSAVASVFGIFSGFWLSYAVLVLGLTHNWFGVAAADATSAQELFLTTWLVVLVLLTLATLRLPLTFTALFALIDLAVLLLLIATAQGSAGLVTFSGYVVLAFAALGVYIWLGTMAAATGGRAVPLGNPIM